MKLFQIQGLLDASKVIVLNHADFAFNAIFVYMYLGIFRLKTFQFGIQFQFSPKFDQEKSVEGATDKLYLLFSDFT